MRGEKTKEFTVDSRERDRQTDKQTDREAERERERELGGGGAEQVIKRQIVTQEVIRHYGGGTENQIDTTIGQLDNQARCGV